MTSPPSLSVQGSSGNLTFDSAANCFSPCFPSFATRWVSKSRLIAHIVGIPENNFETKSHYRIIMIIHLVYQEIFNFLTSSIFSLTIVTFSITNSIMTNMYRSIQSMNTGKSGQIEKHCFGSLHNAIWACYQNEDILLRHWLRFTNEVDYTSLACNSLLRMTDMHRFFFHLPALPISL